MGTGALKPPGPAVASPEGRPELSAWAIVLGSSHTPLTPLWRGIESKRVTLAGRAGNDTRGKLQVLRGDDIWGPQ